jgi:hypothetical protein
VTPAAKTTADRSSSSSCNNKNNKMPGACACLCFLLLLLVLLLLAPPPPPLAASASARAAAGLCTTHYTRAPAPPSYSPSSSRCPKSTPFLLGFGIAAITGMRRWLWLGRLPLAPSWQLGPGVGGGVGGGGGGVAEWHPFGRIPSTSLDFTTNTTGDNIPYGVLGL